MANPGGRGKTNQILHFIQQFTNDHGYSPTIREIGNAVGLKSTSTVSGYLSRMEKKGLVTQMPGTPRSLRIVDDLPPNVACASEISVLNCTFNFPEGTHPVRIVAMVSDGKHKRTMTVPADYVEVIQS